MRNGKASVDKLSNSCFSFITQHSYSSITSLMWKWAFAKYRITVFWGLKIRAKGRPHQWTAEKKSSFSPSFCASLLFSISSFSVLLGNSVIFPSSTLQRTARLCKRGQNCKRGTAGKSTVVAIWTKHWKMAKVIYYSIECQTSTEIGHLIFSTLFFFFLHNFLVKM